MRLLQFSGILANENDTVSTITSNTTRSHDFAEITILVLGGCGEGVFYTKSRHEVYLVEG
jgi:hypothetical protein